MEVTSEEHTGCVRHNLRWITFLGRFIWNGRYGQVLVTLALTGCATQGPPGGLDHINQKWVENRTTHYTTYPIPADDDPFIFINTASARNDLIDDFLRLIDNQYETYVTRIRREKSYTDVALDLVGIGLGTGGTLTGSTGVKTTLAALSTALTGGRSSFNKNVLLDQTIPVLISKMDALRAKKKTAIRALMRDATRNDTPLSQYSVREALTDLTEYYAAGTVTRALTGIADDAAVEKKKAEKQAETYRGISDKINDL